MNFRILIFTVLQLVILPLQATTTKYVNANGYSVNAKGELVQFSTIVVNNDRIEAVYSNQQQAKAKQHKSDKIIDLKGQTVLPGLVDAHGHVLGLGAGLIKVDLRGSTSEEEAVKRVQSFISRQGTTGDSNWITGDGWNQVLWPTKDFPSKASLDKAFPNNPVILSRVDGHAAWANSKALELAGIDKNTISPPGGEIVRDENGEATGLLIDNAENLVRAVIPNETDEQLLQHLEIATKHLLALGITSVHDAGISRQDRDLYIKQANKNALKIRIYAMLSATDPELKRMLKDGHFEDKNGFMSIRSVKVFGDGALGSRGAALLTAYSDDPKNKGLLVTSKESLPSVFNSIIGANFQLNIHAIGDRANRLALNQFKESQLLFKENASRHRIEHAQVVAVEDIPLFVKYDIIASMQPTHATSDMNMAADRIGWLRLRGAYAWKTFLNKGVKIALGSDFPVELANPFHGLHAAVTRQNANNQPEGGWIAKEKLSRVEALKGFTIDAAYAGFQEDMLGSLEVGKKADFIVINKDYFTIDASEIRDIEVLETYVNGEQVFAR